MNRKDAINHIVSIVAKTGSADSTMRYYVENRISFASYKKAIKRGMDIYRGSNAERKTC